MKGYFDGEDLSPSLMHININGRCILGIAEAGTTILEDTGSYYLPGDKLNVAALGSTDQTELLQSWLYNVKKLIRVDRIEYNIMKIIVATKICLMLI